MCGECVKAGLPADRCALAEENTARKNRPLLAAWDLIPLACLWLRKFCVSDCESAFVGPKHWFFFHCPGLLPSVGLCVSHQDVLVIRLIWPVA